MSVISYNELYFFLPNCCSLLFLWVFFFYNNVLGVRFKSYNPSSKYSKDSKVYKYLNLNLKLDVLKPRLINIYVNVYVILIYFSFITLLLLFGKDSTCFFNHLLINNFSLKIVCGFIFLGLILSQQFKMLLLNKLRISYEYLFILMNLIILLPYLFCVNTFFIFIFLLELVSCFIFYKLISSKL